MTRYSAVTGSNSAAITDEAAVRAVFERYTDPPGDGEERFENGYPDAFTQSYRIEDGELSISSDKSFF